MQYFVTLFAVLAIGGAAYAAAPSQDQQSKVEASLKAQGFAKWKRIEFDHGIWEVDDAFDASGKQFDLRVDATSLRTISKVAE